MIVEADIRKKYVTYLEDEFNYRKLVDYKYVNDEINSLNKPTGCLWASPVDASYSWMDYCTDNEILLDRFNHSIEFNIKEGNKILEIGMKDVENYGKQESYINNYIVDDRLDFKKLYNDGIVAVELLDACIGHCFINKLEANFNAWDCDSIVILNPECINITDIK